MITQKKDKKPLHHLMFAGHLKITIRVLGITIGTMAILGGIGYLLDKQLNTYPTVFIIGLFIAFPITQLAIYKTFKKLSKKINQ